MYDSPATNTLEIPQIARPRNTGKRQLSPTVSPRENARSKGTRNVAARGRSNRQRRAESSPDGVSPARVCALAVARRVFEQGAYADRALHGEARRLNLSARDRALAMRLAYGVVQRRDTLDHVIVTLAGRPLAKLEPAVLAALRLGVLQLAFLDRVPAHAAVTESVELAKRESRAGAGLVNAVLRRAAREARAMVEALPDATPAEAALRHSYPTWIAEPVVRRTRPGDGARADGGRQRARRGGRARQRAAHDRCGPRDKTAGRVPRRRPPARGPRARRAVRRVRVATMGAGPVHAAVARRDGGRPRRRAAAGGGGPRPLRRARWQVDPPGRADARRGPRRGGRAPPRPRRGASAHCRPHGRDQRRGADRRRHRAAGAGRVRPRARRSAVLGPRDAGRAARRALAQGPGRRRRAGRAARRRSWPPPPVRSAPAACSCTRPARSPRRENEQRIDVFLGQHADFTIEDPPSDVPVWDHPDVPRLMQTLPHRDGTDGFFMARLRRA